MDPAATARDFEVVHAGGTHFLLLVARPSENRVGVRVDEPGSEQHSATVDSLDVRMSSLEVIARSDRVDTIPNDQHRGVGHDTGVGHRLSAPSSAYADACHHLPGINE